MDVVESAPFTTTIAAIDKATNYCCVAAEFEPSENNDDDGFGYEHVAPKCGES